MGAHISTADVDLNARVNYIYNIKMFTFILNVLLYTVPHFIICPSLPGKAKFEHLGNE